MGWGSEGIWLDENWAENISGIDIFMKIKKYIGTNIGGSSERRMIDPRSDAENSQIEVDHN